MKTWWDRWRKEAAPLHPRAWPQTRVTHTSQVLTTRAAPIKKGSSRLFNGKSSSWTRLYRSWREKCRRRKRRRLARRTGMTSRLRSTRPPLTSKKCRLKAFRPNFCRSQRKTINSRNNNKMKIFWALRSRSIKCTHLSQPRITPLLTLNLKALWARKTGNKMILMKKIRFKALWKSMTCFMRITIPNTKLCFKFKTSWRRRKR